ncbi:hypothetical protein [Deinococcus sp. UYEF24]
MSEPSDCEQRSPYKLEGDLQFILFRVDTLCGDQIMNMQIKYIYGVINTEAPDISDFIHPDDRYLIEDYLNLALKIGRFEENQEDAGYYNVDFGFVRIKIRSSEFIVINHLSCFIGDIVLANGDRASISDALWNFKNSYPYFLVVKGNRKSSKWYLESELKNWE